MTDKEAIQQIRAGRRELYRILVQRYQRPSLVQALRLLRSQTEAEDAVQECFVKALERLHQFDLSRAFFPWFRTILRHHCLKRIERLRREQPEDAQKLVESKSGAANTELQLSVHEALERLSENDRQLLIAKHVEGRNYEEIGALLGIPGGTVMSRLFAARGRMRVLLEERG